MNEKDLQRLKEAIIMDDNFGRIVFQDKESGLELLRILEIIDDTSVVTHYETRADIKNMNNRSIVLDIYVINEQSEIDIEIENKKERAIAKRPDFTQVKWMFTCLIKVWIIKNYLTTSLYLFVVLIFSKKGFLYILFEEWLRNSIWSLEMDLLYCT